MQSSSGIKQLQNHSNGALYNRQEMLIGGGKRISLVEVLKIVSGNVEVVLDEPTLIKIDHELSSQSETRISYTPSTTISSSFTTTSTTTTAATTPTTSTTEYPVEYSRAALFIKLVSLMQGKSGISSGSIRYMTKLLNDNDIPSFSSDEWAGKEIVDYIYNKGQYNLSLTEATTMITSRFFLTGVTAYLTAVTSNISTIIDPVAALSAEYYGVDIESFDSNVFESNRQHRGQISAASNLKLLLEGSKRLGTKNFPSDTANTDQILVYKTIPQINGSLQESMASIVRSMEIELNSVEEGPLNCNSPIIFAPIPARIALSSVISFLDLTISSSCDRQSVFQNITLPSFPSLSPCLSTTDCILYAQSLIDRAWSVLTNEVKYLMEKFDEIDSLTSMESSDSKVVVNDDEDEDKPTVTNNKKSMKPETDDSKFTPEQLAKIEAKRKAKADKAAAKALLKESKKQLGGKALVLGQGTSQIRQFISSFLGNSTTSVKLSDILNPYDSGDGFNTNLTSYYRNLLERLNSGAMSKRKPKIAKGARDFTPDQMRIREQAFAVIRRVFKRHGGVEIDTPVFELKEVLTGKYGEDSKLIYDLADQGGELLSLRYDLTVPFARFLAMNSVGNIKRFHIAKVYRRDQPQPQRGRYREFYQCDFDIAGVYTPMIPDAEAITVVTEILSELPVGNFLVKLNHRKILDAIFELCGVPPEKFRTICSAVDKLDKMSWEDVKKEMVQDKGLAEDSADQIGTFVLRASKEDPRILVNEFLRNNTFRGHEAATKSLGELILLFNYLEAMGALKYVSFDLSLARGLDYYTGVIYEVVLTDGTSQVGSISAGGRYDNLVGMFSASGMQTPCVGVSIGIERVFAIMEKRAEELKLLQKSTIQVYVASIGDDLLTHRMSIAKCLWQSNMSCEFSYQPSPKFKKQLDEVLERGIPYMIVFGEEEVVKKIVKVKSIAAKTEVEVDISDINTMDYSNSSTTRLITYLVQEGCLPMHAGTDLSFVQ